MKWKHRAPTCYGEWHDDDCDDCMWRSECKADFEARFGPTSEDDA